MTDAEISPADRAQLTEQGVEVVVAGTAMIVTVTPNPSIDRTVTLPARLVRGAVHRVQSVSTEPGGKGSTSRAPHPGRSRHPRHPAGGWA